MGIKLFRAHREDGGLTAPDQSGAWYGKPADEDEVNKAVNLIPRPLLRRGEGEQSVSPAPGGWEGVIPNLIFNPHQRVFGCQTPICIGGANVNPLNSD